MNSIKKILIRFGKQSLSNIVGTITDTFVLWLCSHYFFNGFAAENILSPFISFECANLVNFIFAIKFVFKDRITESRFKTILKRYLTYNTSYIATFLIKIILLLEIQAITQLDIVWCNLIALGITGILNFIISDKVIFKPKRNDNDL